MRNQIWTIGGYYGISSHIVTKKESSNKVSLEDVISNGGKTKLTENQSLGSVTITASVEIDLNNKTLDVTNITNSGTLVIKNGTIKSETSSVFINSGKLILDNVEVSAAKYAIYCDNKDYTSIPGESGEPTMSIKVTNSTLTGGTPYAVKNLGYGRVTVDNSTVNGGLSIESCYGDITNSTLIANKYYGLHIYCGIVNYSNCTIKGANDKDIYIQIKSEVNSESYESTVNGTTYTLLDVTSGTGILL